MNPHCNPHCMGSTLHMVPAYAGFDYLKNMDRDRLVGLVGVGLLATTLRKKGTKRKRAITRIAGILMMAYGLRSSLMEG